MLHFCHDVDRFFLFAKYFWHRKGQLVCQTGPGALSGYLLTASKLVSIEPDG